MSAKDTNNEAKRISREKLQKRRDAVLVKRVQRQERQETKMAVGNALNLLEGVLTTVLILLIIIMMIRFSRDMPIPTLQSLLDTFSKVSEPTIPFINFTQLSLGDWGNILNPIRDFFAFTLEIVNVLIFFTNGILSCITYIIYFMRWIFVV